MDSCCCAWLPTFLEESDVIVPSLRALPWKSNSELNPRLWETANSFTWTPHAGSVCMCICKENAGAGGMQRKSEKEIKPLPKHAFSLLLHTNQLTLYISVIQTACLAYIKDFFYSRRNTTHLSVRAGVWFSYRETCVSNKEVITLSTGVTHLLYVPCEKLITDRTFCVQLFNLAMFKVLKVPTRTHTTNTLPE